MADCVSARASVVFSRTRAGVAARVLGAFCEKPWEWAMNRPQPHPANAMPAIRRVRAMTRMISRLCPSKLYGDAVGVTETQGVSSGGRQHLDADCLEFSCHRPAVESRDTDAEAID